MIGMVYFEIKLLLLRTYQVVWWRKIQLKFHQRDQGHRVIPWTGPECEGMSGG